MPKSRSEIPPEDRWNVEALYSDPEAWRQELAQVQGQEKSPRWPELNTYKGRLSDPQTAASLMEYYIGVDRKLSKLHTYAHLRVDEDLGNDSFKTNYGLISSLLHEFQFETSWIEPELLTLNEENFRKLTSHPSLRPFHFYFEKIGRMRPHTLTPQMEELMALSGKALDTSYRTFAALSNVDMTFAPAIDSKKEEHPLSNGTYLSYLRSPDREFRKSAFQNLHRAYETHANSLCELIQGQIQSHLFFARARKFNTCLDAALFPHQIDRSVYENLIASVRSHLPAMHRYVALRKKLMKLDKIHIYDLYVPLVEESQASMNYAEARQAVVDSVAPLGKDYQESLK
ncbi:MAG TPA: M3 family metallopeptidase, partial [Chlamydiales bacterium]|nr:M3 family metallopeptidase [Chlamydiales bacterium]